MNLATSKGNIYLQRIRRSLRIQTYVVVAASGIIGLVCAAMTYAALCRTGLSHRALLVCAWILLAIVGVATRMLARNCLRNERSRAGENIKLMFPEQEKDLDFWLSRDIAGAQKMDAYELATCRLNESLPPDREISLNRGPVAVFFVLLCLGAAIGIFHVVTASSPVQSVSSYLWALTSFRNTEHPVKVVSFSPSCQWVKRNKTIPFSIEFDREPASVASISVLSREPDFVLSLRRRSDLVYETEIPPQSEDFAIKVKCGQQESGKAVFYVYPQKPRLESVEICTPLEKTVRKAKPGDFPLKVRESSLLSFRVRMAYCPFVQLELRSSSHPGIPLVREGETSLYRAAVRVRQSDRFCITWHTPGDKLEKGEEYAVVCENNNAPAVELIEPLNGAVLASEPASLKIRAKGEDADGIQAAWLYLTDYHGLKIVITQSVVMVSATQYSMETALDTALLDARQGRVIGICAAMQDRYQPGKSAFSEIANIVLPVRQHPASGGEDVDNSTGPVNLGKTEDSNAGAKDPGASKEDSDSKISGELTTPGVADNRNSDTVPGQSGNEQNRSDENNRPPAGNRENTGNNQNGNNPQGQNQTAQNQGGQQTQNSGGQANPANGSQQQGGGQNSQGGNAGNQTASSAAGQNSSAQGQGSWTPPSGSTPPPGSSSADTGTQTTPPGGGQSATSAPAAQVSGPQPEKGSIPKGPPSSGSGPGAGNGAGPTPGAGQAPGPSAPVPGSGPGAGQGPGSGSGQGPGSGQGQGSGQGTGTGTGNSSGDSGSSSTGGNPGATQIGGGGGSVANVHRASSNVKDREIGSNGSETGGSEEAEDKKDEPVTKINIQFGRKGLKDTVEYRESEDSDGNTSGQEEPQLSRDDAKKALPWRGNQVDVDEKIISDIKRGKYTETGQLSATEMEKRIERYKKSASSLSSEERQMVQDYWRTLKDLR